MAARRARRALVRATRNRLSCLKRLRSIFGLFRLSPDSKAKSVVFRGRVKCKLDVSGLYCVQFQLPLNVLPITLTVIYFDTIIWELKFWQGASTGGHVSKQL